jgi:hypothetical protein
MDSRPLSAAAACAKSRYRGERQLVRRRMETFGQSTLRRTPEVKKAPCRTLGDPLQNPYEILADLCRRPPLGVAPC